MLLSSGLFKAFLIVSGVPNQVRSSTRIHLPRWLLQTLLLCGLTTLSTPLVQAQVYHSQTIVEADGLPSPEIKSITQDRWGLIWITTRNGLAFHNGLTWQKVNIDSLTNDISQGLLRVDGGGDLWALFSGFQPSLIRKNLCSWESIPLPAAKTGNPVVYSDFALAQVNNQPIIAIIEKPNQVSISSPVGWQQAPLAQNGISQVNALATLDGEIILATDQGAYSFPASDPTKIRSLSEMGIPGIVTSLCLNTLDNSLWLTGNDWIGTITDGVFKIILPPQGQVFSCFVDSPHRICQTDGFGGIYLSGGYCTQYFHPSLGLHPHESDSGFMSRGSNAFFLDREKVIWQGTTNGIIKVISRHTTGYNSRHGLLNDEVTALLRRKDGTLVVGHTNGLTLWNDEKTTIPFQNHDLRDRVLDLAEDSAGNIWIAGRQRGLGKLSLDGSLQWWSLNTDFPNYFSSVLVDEKDRIWVTAGNKVLILEKGEFREFHLPAFANHGTYLRRLIQGRARTIYIATGNRGVIAIKDGEISHWTTGLKDHGNSVYDILETPDGITWVGTRNGLYRLEDGRLKRPSESQFILNRPVYFLETDQQDRLWLGTDNGVIRIDGTKVDHFTVENGLIGRETNRCASLVDPDGKMWVGTESGLTVFDDLFENKNPLPPLVYLAVLGAGGQTYPLFPDRENITLPNQSESLVFKYRVFTTTEPNRLRVLTRLNGLEKDWVESTAPGDQVARYSHLKPGTYQLQVQAAGFGQPWSKIKTSPDIIIPAPVWQRTWFLILAALIVLAILSFPIILLAQRRYTTRLRQEVAEQVAANLRIEAELEQSRNLLSLGVLAGGIAHDFNNLLTIIFGNLSLLQGDDSLDPSHRKRLSAATGAIDRARGLTNQLLTFSRGGAPVLEVGSLTNLVRESADFVLRGSSTRCRFQLPNDLWPVVMDSSQMSQVVNNLLMNAREAMPNGGSLTLSGSNLDQGPAELPPGKYVEILVADDGPGVDPEILNQIFDPYFSTKENGSGLGLATAFSILNRHQGKLSVQSRLGKGTTFRLLVPASESQPLHKPESVQISKTPLQGRVLILDDDPDVRESLGLMLTKLGLKVEETAEGNQTLARYRENLKQNNPPDVVLMDLTIPGGRGGQEIIGPLLEMDPNAKAVVLSGYSHDPVISRYRDFGFRAAIAKPITMDELGAVLKQVLAD